MAEAYFAESGPLVELIYGRDGTPVAVLRGKKREREKDYEAMLAWLVALKGQILSAREMRAGGE